MPVPIVILTYFNIFGSGGMETHVQRLMRELSRLGFMGRVVTPADVSLQGASQGIGNFAVTVVGPPTAKWFPWTDFRHLPRHLVAYWVRNFRIMLKVVEALREIDGRVLYVPGPVNLPSTATLNVLPFWLGLRLVRGTRVVLGARGAASHWYERPTIARLFAIEEASQLRFASAVAVVDHYYAQVLFPPRFRNKCTVIPNGVDPSVFRPTENPHGRTVTFVGRLSRDRGIDVFLDAVEQLRNADGAFEVVGDGPLREWFLQRVREGKLPIAWAGDVPHSEMPSVYDRSYVVVNPSPVEGIGNITLEAMASGKCVIRAGSSYKEFAIRDGINGLIFRRGDARSLADRIAQALSEPELVARLGREARATVLERFTVEVEAKAYAGLFVAARSDGS